MTTAVQDLTDPQVVYNEFREIREQVEELTKRLDRIEAAQPDIAKAARAREVNAQSANRAAEGIADVAAAGAGHLRLAVATGIKDGERYAKRLADLIIAANGGRH